MPIHMTVTSIWYLLLIAGGFCIYYIVPKRLQWLVLLAMSLVFYYFAGVRYTFVYLIFSTGVTYLATYMMDRCLEEGREKVRGIILFAAIVLNVLPWLLTSASNLWVSLSVHINHAFSFMPALHALPFAAAIGMAYYTSQVIAYIVDCYWGSVERQKNPVKLLTFVCFFPQLTTGPISRYDNLKTIYAGHTFQYKNLCFGAQRILWGFFKKLVVADRTSMIVNAVWNDLSGYYGLWHWVALLLYPILIYCDFSGCMDIVLGTAELFDIHLEENFRNPFFSRSIREFWSRWHITLGKWAKDYVMFPILKSSRMVTFTKKAKKRFGKRMGKYIPAAFASGMVWLVMGIWHGGFRHIVGVSLYYWVLIELGEFFDPVWARMIPKLGINTEKFSWRLFQRIRTYCIYAFGAVFFQANSIRAALSFLKSLFSMFWNFKINPWIFFDGSIVNTGITYGGLNLIVIGVALLLAAAILRERYSYAREWIAGQGLWLRWILWITLFLIVLIYGAYGPGYDASEFIYQGF